MQRASTARLALAALACCTTVLAQQPDPQPPASRVETIERERAAKAATLAPETLPKPELITKRFQDERILERLMDEVDDIAVIESSPRQEGNQLHTIFAPRPGAAKRVAARNAEEQQ